jgi:hypothetical protein
MEYSFLRAGTIFRIHFQPPKRLLALAVRQVVIFYKKVKLSP